MEGINTIYHESAAFTMTQCHSECKNTKQNTIKNNKHNKHNHRKNNNQADTFSSDSNDSYDEEPIIYNNQENEQNKAVLEKLSNIDDELVEYYEALLDRKAPRRFIIRKKRGLITHKTNNGYQGPQEQQTQHYDFNDYDSFEYQDDDDIYLEQEEQNNTQEDYEVEYYENELYKRYSYLFHEKVGKYIPKEEEPDYSLLFINFDSIFNKKETHHGKKEPKRNKHQEKVVLFDI